jgi:hypothetical protein
MFKRDFCRTTWVSEEARLIWHDRRSAAAAAFQRAEAAAVAMGIRQLCILHLSKSQFNQLQLWSQHWGVSCVVVGRSADDSSLRTRSPNPGESFKYRVIVAKQSSLSEASEAISCGWDDVVGRLLGYPECCRKFFIRTWNSEHKVDPTWSMVSAFAESSQQTSIEIVTDWRNNILQRWVGVRAVSHLPCSFDCAETRRIGSAMQAVMLEIGFESEAGWIKEILSWPTNWSANHGIAEIRNPVSKLSCNTDHSAKRLEIAIKGTEYPEVGAKGLRHPYATPASAKLTESSAFDSGIREVVGTFGSKGALSHASHPGAISWAEMLDPNRWTEGSLLKLLTIANHFNKRQQLPKMDGLSRAFGGTVALCGCHLSKAQTSEHAFKGSHPNVERGESLLAIWQAAYTQFAELITVLCPFVTPGDEVDRIVGSTCGSSGISEICSLVTNQVGFVDGLVHELGHCKLRALGIELEVASHVIINDEGPVFRSPIRYDKHRPMTAVVHAQYSFLHVLDLNRRIVESNVDQEFASKLCRETIAIKLPRLRFGHQVLDQHLKVAEGSEEFRTELLAWSASVLDSATALLASKGIREGTFAHPLPSLIEGG